MIMFRPTRGGLLFTGACAVAVAAALMNVGLVTALTASVLCSVLLADFLLCLLAAAGYKVERHLAEEGCCNEMISLPVTVTNRLPFCRQDCVILEKLLFCPGKRAAFEVPCLRPGESVTLERKVRAVRRGHFHLQKLILVSGDPLGLFAVRRSYSLPGEVLIIPKVVLPESFTPDSAVANTFTYEGRLTNRGGSGNDFFGVRPYRTGDEMRHIHWRLSASKGKLMVREFEALSMDRVMLVLDTDQKQIGMDEQENNFEKLLSLAASLTFYLAKHNCQLSLLFHDPLKGVIHLTGEASAIRMDVLENLTDVEGSAMSLEELVRNNLDLFHDGESVCFLRMCPADEGLRRITGLLEDKDCRVIHFYAPRECFPYIPDDEPYEFTIPPVEQSSYPGGPLTVLVHCRSSFDEWKVRYEDE